MTILVQHAAEWIGTNGFRLMPGDDPFEASASATVTPGAKGHLTTVAYTWAHPDDGAQEGLLVLGVGEGGSPVGTWADSWHQQPAPQTLSGERTGDGALLIGYDYADGWSWLIAVDATDPDLLRLRMDNVVPRVHATDDVPAGPYPAMAMSLRRRPEGTDRVTGIGGLFFRSRDSAALTAWYTEKLGIAPPPPDYDTSSWRQEAGPTVFAPFPAGSEHFGSADQQWSVNFRVRDLDAVLARLRASGVDVREHAQSYPNGRFAELTDPEGNPIQLWEPAGADG